MHIYFQKRELCAFLNIPSRKRETDLPFCFSCMQTENIPTLTLHYNLFVVFSRNRNCSTIHCMLTANIAFIWKLAKNKIKTFSAIRFIYCNYCLYMYVYIKISKISLNDQRCRTNLTYYFNHCRWSIYARNSGGRIARVFRKILLTKSPKRGTFSIPCSHSVKLVRASRYFQPSRNLPLCNTIFVCGGRRPNKIAAAGYGSDALSFSLSLSFYLSIYLFFFYRT